MGAWAAFSSLRFKLSPGLWERMAPIVARQSLRAHCSHPAGKRLRGLKNAGYGAEQPAKTEVALFKKLHSFGYRPLSVYHIPAFNVGWSFSISPIFFEASFHVFDSMALSMPLCRDLMRIALTSCPHFHLHSVTLSGKSARLKPMVSNSSQLNSVNGLPGKNTESDIPGAPLHLDDFVASRGLPPPNIIRIDAPGGGFEILRGAVEALQRADIIVMPASFYRDGSAAPMLDETMQFLSPFDFLLTNFGSSYHREHHTLSHVDAVFMKAPFLDGIETASGQWNW